MSEQKTRIAKLIRLDEADAALLDRLVEETGLSQSVIYRRLIRAIAVGDPFDQKAAQAIEQQLRKIGVNLNQVARRYNSGQVVQDEELAMALEKVAEGLARTVREFRSTTQAAQAVLRTRLGDDAP
ncbi:plasmid mobilization relaxosome protein MobC [Rhizobium sp. VS19-DR104.2]|uniref:plasmid mobilization relaxosome protein MobC n=1 Tax=unclassified Rhizobium TaxID=2613769 RepID=UPI001CC801EF|nr:MULTISPECIES: plasmid mobilization relaxosome protein MobC [unclassified Rhizobium]MBZ5762272.1 plasmid mobilization relaxosome protein MobC [Rhizobium sp. VS19-DR96]MBZ5768288.1 plasmid mobilization relaxosome protein MobC [Rhizobium sp. VS19-DR129.2]MBZ5775840.1 plasmid mobilization relaxosome protein MobC [Rhizobium sp. VS19-DRK62.2]MBZ5787139.1 plasmid mobilization relaxosome protein MobC [Rhizobium sp. VS19-DR121]MBZ5804214.1 plasmid mobilization relaxosome protein MobC [Rhizobium sp. 